MNESWHSRALRIAGEQMQMRHRTIAQQQREDIRSRSEHWAQCQAGLSVDPERKLRAEMMAEAFFREICR